MTKITRSPLRTWRVFEKDREYAKHFGDPCICEVEANSKEEAEEKAAKNYFFMTGPLALVKAKNKPQRQTEA